MFGVPDVGEGVEYARLSYGESSVVDTASLLYATRSYDESSVVSLAYLVFGVQCRIRPSVVDMNLLSYQHALNNFTAVLYSSYSSS